MAYGLPERGQHDYDDELNNSIEYVRGQAESAKAAADNAVSTAATAYALAQSAGDLAGAVSAAETAATEAEASATTASGAAASASSSATAAADSAAAAEASLSSYEPKVPRAGATSGQVPTLQGDGTLAFGTVAGSGDVVGPSSAVNNQLVVFDGTTGKLVKDGGATVAGVRDRSAHTGTQSADTITDGTTNKAYTAAEKTKLAGVATGATANSADATLLARANHTGTQAASTITGLATVATSGAYADLSGKPSLGDAAAKNTGTTTGTLAAGDDSRLIDNAKSVGGGKEKSAALSATTGTCTGDLSAASVFTITPTGNWTLAFSNVPASGTACTVTVIVAQGADTFTMTQPAGVTFVGSAAPTVVASKVRIYTYLTVDGGTTWYASAVVQP